MMATSVHVGASKCAQLLRWNAMVMVGLAQKFLMSFCAWSSHNIQTLVIADHFQSGLRRSWSNEKCMESVSGYTAWTTRRSRNSIAGTKCTPDRNLTTFELAWSWGCLCGAHTRTAIQKRIKKIRDRMYSGTETLHESTNRQSLYEHLQWCMGS